MWGTLPMQIFDCEKMFSCCKNFLPKTQNLGLEIPILGNLEAKI